MKSQIKAIVQKDLKQFFSDRKSMVISYLVPVAIACFFGVINLGGNSGKPRPITVTTAPTNGTADAPFFQRFLNELSKKENVKLNVVTETEARKLVADGRTTVAVLVPANLDSELATYFMGMSEKPKLEYLVDPTNVMGANAIRGLTIEAAMSVATPNTLGEQSSAGQGLPIELLETRMASDKTEDWASVAHPFAGMAVQGILFFAVEAAMGLMRDRKSGLWRRMRAAPVPIWAYLFARLISSTVRAFTILVVVLAVGMLLFGFRITGDPFGMFLIALTASLMSGGFGIMVASLGNNEAQSRGLTTLAVLLMSMLGGAWFPSFMLPTWIQTVALFTPVSWAVNGFDAMLWRGQDLAVTLVPSLMLIGFAALFTGIGAFRFYKLQEE